MTSEGTAPLPAAWIPPMKAILGDLPTGDHWAFELKWDGVRLQAACNEPAASKRLALRSISGREVTSTYPEFEGLAEAVGLPAVLDGEAVVFDGDRPSFGRLQHRMHVGDPGSALVAEHPAVFMVFDLLVLDGRPLLELDYSTRRRLLTDVIEDGPSWRLPPEVRGEGQTLLELARARGLEGVVAKKLTSTYRPGARTKEWIKVKIRKQQEFVVGGWLPGQGALEGNIGSLLIGVQAGGALRFAGAVGSGLADRDRARLAPLLISSENCPFAERPPLDRSPVWVEPTQVIEVGYGSWPEEGNLRHPVYLGLRVDHRPEDVVRELPP